MRNPRIAQMIFNQPLLVTPDMMQTAVRWANDQLQVNVINNLPVEAKGIDVDYHEPQERCSLTVANGIAIIPVHGVLVSRMGHVDLCSKMTSYEYLSTQLRAALKDDDIEHIVFDIDTNGGAATGAFEFAEEVFEARQVKPITAIVNFSAYSGGYIIAAACSEIVVSMTSGVGSIGVIAEHLEWSKYNDEIGVKITTVFRGDHKNNLTPNEPISDQSLQFLNEIVQESYDMFVNAVAKYRNLDVQSVIDTQAGLFRGQKAVDIGLADRVEAPNLAINSIAASIPPKAIEPVRMESSGTIQRRAAAMKMKAEL